MGNEYTRVRKKLRRRFRKLMELYKELYYYGCEVDSWLPLITFLPYVTLSWKNDPTWYRVISPPGSGKSQHLSMLEGYDLTYTIDEFTPKSFISGFRGNDGNDPSKLPQMDGKVLIISDESTLMEQRQEDRNMVQSLLRRAYDGTVSKAFGNLKDKQEYKTNFNLLVGSTPSIDRYFAYNQSLGERYTNFRCQVPNRREIAKRAYENQFVDFPGRKEELIRRVHAFLRSLPAIGMREIPQDPGLGEILIDCANYIALIRTHVTRDSTGRNITTLPQPECAGRLVKQMTQTALSIAIVQGAKSVTLEHVRVATYIGLCSLSALQGYMLWHIWEYSKGQGLTTDASWFSAKDMEEFTGLGHNFITRGLEDYVVQHVITRRRGKGSNVRKWMFQLNNNSIEIIQKTNLFRDYVPPEKKIIEEQHYEKFRHDKPITRRKKKGKRKMKVP